MLWLLVNVLDNKKIINLYSFSYVFQDCFMYMSGFLIRFLSHIYVWDFISLGKWHFKNTNKQKTSEIAGSGNISEREKIQISYSYKQTDFLDKMQFENC